MEVKGNGRIWDASRAKTGKVTEIGRLETRDCSIDSRDSYVLCLSSGKTSSKSVEQHGLPLSEGVSVSSVVAVLALWQHEWVSETLFRVS